MLGLDRLSMRRIHLMHASCMRELRALLASEARPLTLTQMRVALRGRWASHEISSSLAKLRVAGRIQTFAPIEPGALKGKRYGWVLTEAVAAGGHLPAAVQRDSAPATAGRVRRAGAAVRRAGLWDGLVAAAETGLAR